MLAQTLGGTEIHGSVTLGNWVVWSEAVVPEGSYTLTVEYAHAPVKATLRSAHGKTQVFFR
jgi:hypothetical protein